MYLKFRNGEYIILYPGEKELCFKEYISSLKKVFSIRIISQNAYIASCLQNGIIIGYGKGHTVINVYRENENIRNINVIVLPICKKHLPVLVNRYNGVIEKYFPKDLIKIEAGTVNWNIYKDIYACKDVVEAYNKMSRSRI